VCGIVGIALPDGETPDPALLRAMADTLAHRGPDGDGVRVVPGCGFGHRRLAIVDLSPASAQPMATPDGGAMLTFNGEVYDYAAVRESLAAQGVNYASPKQSPKQVDRVNPTISRRRFVAARCA
jgi:asparagine synthase (glutamine-hydrolysing)